jgi:N-acetylglucosamine malate deacetylase 2
VEKGSAKINVLAFFAHPDDETILAGGVLALLAKEGAQVHYLCATRGEGGELGEPPSCTREQLGAVRESELVCAVQSLGGRSLTFLGHVDPLVGADGQMRSYSDNLTFVAGQVASSLSQFAIDIVLTHGSNGEYGHPAHIFSFQAALTAVQSLAGEGKAPVLYTVAAVFAEHPNPRLANQDDPADLVVDIHPVLNNKVAAALCHKTQHALFVRRASIEARRAVSVAEVIMSVESFHRVYPPAGEITPGDILTDILADNLKAAESRGQDV